MKCFCKTVMVNKTVNGISYMECPSCGYLRKMTDISSLEEKKRYDSHICDEGYFKYMHKVYEKIKPYVKGECLDYGCGQVHALSDILEEEGYASSYYDLYYYPLMPEKLFDTVILIEVFEHIADTMRLMENLMGILKEKGRIIIMTQVKKYPLEEWWYLRDITHRTFVDEKTMEELASVCGLHLISEEGYFVFEKM